MSYEHVMNTVGPNGRAIIGRIDSWKDARKDIQYTPTQKGFHVCLVTNEESIRLVQVWGEIDQPTTQVIETRLNLIPGHFNLTKDEMKRIFILFRKAGFQQKGSGHFNTRLEFGRADSVQFGPPQLAALEDALNGMVDTIKKRP